MKHSTLILLLLTACGEQAPTADGGFPADAESGLDASVLEDAGGPSLEIGTGVDRFEELVEGQEIEIILGPQGGGRWGGFHVWHGVKTQGFDPEGIMLSFRTYLADTREEIASQERRANLIPLDGTSYVAYGIAPPFLDCCKAEDQDIILAVEIRDATGRTGTSEKQAHATYCLDASGASVCP